MRNILDFGAVGDGVTVNTSAIQAAIDMGGTVYIPAGVFVTGTLYLKSGGGLHLAPDAVLRASHDRADYNALDYCPQNQRFSSEFMNGTHLITAVCQENVFIEGEGTIDGDSHFWVNESHMSSYCDFFDHPPMEAERPGQMIYFVECRGVRVRDVHLLHSPFWHLFCHGCQDVQIRGISVKGECRQWVNDGIDIDCCQNVTISDCIIETGDDGITLRASGARLVNSPAVCENITVSNCILTSYLDYGIRIGVGEGIIRNCLFSNIRIKDSLLGIGMTNRFSPAGSVTSIENISFSNVSVEAMTAFEFKISNIQSHPALPKPAYTRHIRFDGLSVRTCRVSLLVGFEGAELADFSFRDVSVDYYKEDPNNSRFPCKFSDIKDKKAVFYVKNAKDLRVSDMTVRVAPDCEPLSAFIVDDPTVLTLKDTVATVVAE